MCIRLTGERVCRNIRPRRPGQGGAFAAEKRAQHRWKSIIYIMDPQTNYRARMNYRRRARKKIHNFFVNVRSKQTAKHATNFYPFFCIHSPPFASSNWAVRRSFYLLFVFDWIHMYYFYLYLFQIFAIASRSNAIRLRSDKKVQCFRLH